MSFYRDKNIPTGGPDGGDGGRGGSVIMRVDTAKNTLIDFRFRHKFFAEHGAKGGANKKTQICRRLDHHGTAGNYGAQGRYG